MRWYGMLLSVVGVACLSGCASMKAFDHYAAGIQYHKQAELENALAEYTKAIELDPDEFAYFSNRSGLHRVMENYDAAIEDARTAIELTPPYYADHIGALYKGIAEIYALELHEYDKSLVAYKRAREAYQQERGTRPFSARALKLREIESAIRKVERAMLAD